MSFIYDLEYKNEICAVVGICESGDTKYIAFKSYLVDVKVSFNVIIWH
jgi:hypothetical protein